MVHLGTVWVISHLVEIVWHLHVHGVGHFWHLRVGGWGHLKGKEGGERCCLWCLWWCQVHGGGGGCWGSWRANVVERHIGGGDRGKGERG